MAAVDEHVGYQVQVLHLIDQLQGVTAGYGINGPVEHHAKPVALELLPRAGHESPDARVFPCIAEDPDVADITVRCAHLWLSVACSLVSLLAVKVSIRVAHAHFTQHPYISQNIVRRVE